MSVFDIFLKVFVLSGLIAVLLLLYDNLFRPWRAIERSIHELEEELKMLERGGWRAKITTWLNEPWLRGDIEKHKVLLRMRIGAKKREANAYYLLRRGE